MKKVLVAGLIVSAMALAPTARAEHKLLSTEVLDAQQVEVQAAFEIKNAKYDLDSTETLKTNDQELRLSIGAGVGGGLEISASLPYVLFEKEHFEGSEEEKADGLGDLIVGAKYSLMHGEEAPVQLALGLDVKLDTASDADKNVGSGTTDISPYLTLSREIAEHTELYATYRAVLVDQGGADSHALTVGVEKALNETVTLDVALTATAHTSGDEIDSYQSYGAEVAGYIETAKNLYLLPSFAIEQSTSFDAEEGGVAVAVDPKPAYRAGLALYYLY